MRFVAEDPSTFNGALAGNHFSTSRDQLHLSLLLHPIMDPTTYKGIKYDKELQPLRNFSESQHVTVLVKSEKATSATSGILGDDGQGFFV